MKITLPRLALLFFWRDLRAGELTLSILMLCIAMMCSGAISLLNKKLEYTSQQQAAEWLASDLRVSSHQPLPEVWFRMAASSGLKTAETIEFSTMLVENGEMRLASAKGVSDLYPLRGQLTAYTNDPSTASVQAQGPEAGTAWIDEDIAAALHLLPGMTMTLGRKTLAISAILKHEPDRGMHWISLSPRIMFHIQDLAETGLVRTGFHGHYHLLFAGRQADILDLSARLQSELDNGMRLESRYQNSQDRQSGFSFQVARYFNCISLLVTLLCGWGLAMARHHFMRRHLDQTTLLMSLGMRHRSLLALDALQTFLLIIIASLPGTALAIGLEQLIGHASGDTLPWLLALNPLNIWCFIVFYACLLMVGSHAALGMNGKANNTVQMMQRLTLRSRWLLTKAILLPSGILTILLWIQLDDVKLAIKLAFSGYLLLGTLWIMVTRLILLMDAFKKKLPLSWRIGVDHLYRRRHSAGLQMAGLMVTLFCLSFTFVVYKDLIATWERQLPEKTPNFFALGIQEDELATFNNMMIEAGMTGAQTHPIVRARLTAINDHAVTTLNVKGSQGESALHRELNLTESASLPAGNLIVQGNPWNDHTGPYRASIEAQLAEQLDIHIGSKLSFNAGSFPLDVIVDNIRTLRWQDLTPNFYIMLSPGSFKGLPVSWMGSFHLPDQRRQQMQTWTTVLPGVNWLPVGDLMDKLKQHMAQITSMVSELMVSAILASLLVMWVALVASSEDRKKEEHLLYLFGLRRNTLLRARAIEFAIMGMLSGWLAALLLEASRVVILLQFLEIDYPGPIIMMMLFLPLLGGLLAVTISLLQSSTATTRHP